MDPAIADCRDILTRLKSLLPQWSLGVEGADTQSKLIPVLDWLKTREPSLAFVADALSAWAWQEHPLDPDILSLRAGRGPRGEAGSFAADLAPRLLRSIKDAVEPLEELETVFASGDKALVVRFLMVRMREPAIWLALLSRAWKRVLAMGGGDLAPALLDACPWPEDLASLRERLAAERAMHHLCPEDALERVEGLDGNVWKVWRRQARARLLAAKGKKKGALDAFLSLLGEHPWHVNLLLTAHDLLHPASPDPGLLDKGDTAVCIYTWNKADLLSQTLENVAEGSLGTCPVIVLDNGSTDATPEICKAFSDRLGHERFSSVRLPVNVGAPAARNWLLSMEEVSGRNHAAFLDDDVLLPEDWLTRLRTAARDHPDSGAVGCRIRGAEPPRFLQSADYNLFPFPPSGKEAGDVPAEVRVFDNCSGDPDNGLFAYSRPCLSVSGCCHLVSMASVRACGGFDLRYSPTQFDDLDRDMRSWLAGRPTWYEGSLEISHVQFSSLAKAEGPARMGHVLGNKKKLDAQYSAQDLKRLSAAQYEALWQDLLAKAARLDEAVREWRPEGGG